jgi:hypothetical protein
MFKRIKLFIWIYSWYLSYSHLSQNNLLQIKQTDWIFSDSHPQRGELVNVDKNCFVLKHVNFLGGVQMLIPKVLR